MNKLQQEATWEGSTEDFALLCEKWLRLKNIAPGKSSVSVRLVRDYVARGILDKPVQSGKEVYFSYKQLVQFLACKHLIDEGYSLRRITDDIRLSDIEEIRSWIPGETTDRALGLINKFKKASRYEEDAGSEYSLASMAPEYDEKEILDRLEPARAPSSYHERTKRRARYKIDQDPGYFNQYFDAVKEFDKDFSKVIKQDLTAIQLKSWLILFIDRLKLEGLTIEEAEEIGEAIKSALINQAKLPDRDTFMKKDK